MLLIIGPKNLLHFLASVTTLGSTGVTCLRISIVVVRVEYERCRCTDTILSIVAADLANHRGAFLLAA